MTKKELDDLEADATAKFDAYIQANEQLSNENDPGGFTDQQLVQNIARMKQAFEEAQARWNNAFMLYAFERQSQQDN